MTETSRAVGNHEVVTLEGQYVLNTEVSARRLSQHELEPVNQRVTSQVERAQS